MVRSNLINVLKSFSKKEIRELRKWLHSPAHNQREDVIKLFEYLLEDNHLYKDEFLTKEAVYRWIYPKGQAYDDAKMRQSIFFFMKTLEEFLVYQELFQDEVRAKRTLASVYRKRKLEKTFHKAVKSANDLHKKHDFRNGAYFRNEYMLQQEQYSYLSGLKRTGALNLQEVSDALDLTFLADKLRQICLMLSHQRVFKTEYEIGLLQPVLENVETKNYLNVPAIAIYYYGYKTMKERENESHFHNLKKEIEENGHLFPKSELRDIYIMAINYAIGRMNNGILPFIRELFELYRQGFEKELLIDNGIASRWSFRNVVSTGTILKEFDWVEKFIYNYQHHLEEKYRENFVNFCLCKLHFEKGDYDLAQQLLSKYEFNDILMDLNAKTMLCKIYYEQDEVEALESLLDSMASYMRRKKEISTQHRSNYKNIIRFTKKLLKADVSSDHYRSNLRREVETTTPLTERKWLLRQLS